MKREMAILTLERPVISEGKWAKRTEAVEVRVMARAEGYAMVRRKGCVPFVCREKELSKANGAAP